MKKIFLLTTSFFITPVFLVTCIVYLLYLNYNQNPQNYYSHNRSVAYAALPGAQNVQSGEIVEKDARVETVKQFFSRYKSELEPFAQDVIDSADKYGMDHRLIPAIAMQESNLCKKIIKDSHNCWGFGIYGKKVTKFESYPEAIDTVSKTLARDYVGKGLETPDEIMSRYTPSSKGSWAISVNHFMSQLQ